VKRVILPGETIGVLGSGQLGRMTAIAARRMGYRVHTLSPGEETPTGQVADLEIAADYEDLDAIRAFAKGVQVVTFEFENVSTEAAAAAAEIVPVRPSGSALHITQQRAREKAFLADRGFPTTPCAAVRTLDELAEALGWIGTPAIVKTAAFGYDGKGQHRLKSIEDAESVWRLVGHQEVVVERVVEFAKELSVVAARGLAGDYAHFGAIENTHRHHILDLSVAPARIPEATAAEAVAITRAIMDALDYVGVLCVEFFLTIDGRLLVNEIAPRPHNSGHLTFDACVTSQFEQQVRAVCGLPLGSTKLLRPAAMVNLLGELWADGEPDWCAALAFPDVKLHLYGKDVPRVGRKMGHLTATADTVEEAIERALGARDLLAP
jgi:5-(carboxyamino)imidazole ribonucleotide synthase